MGACLNSALELASRSVDCENAEDALGGEPYEYVYPEGGYVKHILEAQDEAEDEDENIKRFDAEACFTALFELV